jgi:tetratricopeptide (TPR) repeat protein
MDLIGTTPASYELLRERGLKSLNQGDLQVARSLFEEALVRAREGGEERLIDRAFCNLAAVEIETGTIADADLIRLREILMRNIDPENCRLAAYWLARAHELKKAYKKALFYARISLDRSTVLERQDWIASSHNTLGNILIAESYFDQARFEYEQALAMMPSEHGLDRALILDNLGYCRTLEGRFTEAFRDLYESLRTLRALGARGFERYPRIGLCFAMLEIGRYRSAHRHGLIALKIADSVGDNDTSKNSLYLLGEAANLACNTRGAREHFRALQERFFPNDRYLPDFLLAIDVRKLINLKA